MADKKEKTDITTKRGTVSGFTAIQKPATNFVPTGMFETQLAFDPSDVQDIVEQLEEIRDAEFEKVKEKNPKVKKTLQKADVTTPETDDEGDETGRVILKFRQRRVIETKSGETFKKTIAVWDAKGKRITKTLKVGPGTIAKVNFEPAPYFNAKDKVVGVTLRLRGVQIIKLVEYQGGGGASAEDMGFDAEEDDDGFDADNLEDQDEDTGEDQSSDDEDDQSEGDEDF